MDDLAFYQRLAQPDTMDYENEMQWPLAKKYIITIPRRAPLCIRIAEDHEYIEEDPRSVARRERERCEAESESRHDEPKEEDTQSKVMHEHEQLKMEGVLPYDEAVEGERSLDI